MISLEERFMVNILYRSESEILNGIDINAINFENLIYHPEIYGIQYAEGKKEKIIAKVNELRPKNYSKYINETVIDLSFVHLIPLVS